VKILFFILAIAIGAASSPAADEARARVLVFSHSTGWRHDSIPAGIGALKAMGERENYVVELSEDPDIFAAGRLDDYDLLVLLNSTSSEPEDAGDGEWFKGPRREALQAFLRAGKGVVGVHGASDSHDGWRWYGQLIGGRFDHHPAGTPRGRLRVHDADHPATAGLPAEFERVDEWYWFYDFNPTVNLLITLDPASIGQRDANPKPIAWTHDVDGGRVFYTAMGHTIESYSDPLFLAHLAGGIRWALDRP
jgi:uncharacterized protein